MAEYFFQNPDKLSKKSGKSYLGVHLSRSGLYITKIVYRKLLAKAKFIGVQIDPTNGAFLLKGAEQIIPGVFTVDVFGLKKRGNAGFRINVGSAFKKMKKGRYSYVRDFGDGYVFEKMKIESPQEVDLSGE